MRKKQLFKLLYIVGHENVCVLVSVRNWKWREEAREL